ncbi:MAG: hypothetical protein ACRD5J_16225, partial [Nitrososphaeraceae archaeon]
SFQIICILFMLGSLVAVSSDRFVDAQITITPGTEEEPEAQQQQLEPEPEPEPVQQPDNGSGKISQVLDFAHFIPLTNSPGNQVKLGIDYTVKDPSFVGQPMSGIMEVFAASNNSLIRTSTLSDPLIANRSGSLEFATTFIDENIKTVRTEVTFTGPNEMRPISNRFSAILTLGQVVEG